MSNSAHFAVLANAILSVDQERDALGEQLSHTLGRRWSWIDPLCRRYLGAFVGTIPPRRREVIAFLRGDQGLRDALQRNPGQIKIRNWFAHSPAMRPVLAARSWPVPAIETVAALAQWSGVTPSELAWLADLKDLNNKRPQPRLEHYHYRFLIKGSSGIRLIEAPKSRLKSLQRKILSGILDRIPAHVAAHGFVPGRSIQTFAAPHVGRRVVLRMDLENFFPSVSGTRVQSFFRTVGYPEPVADLLGGVVTNAVSKRAWREAGLPVGFDVQSLYARPHLPQGAPTSPALANLSCYRVDCRLAGLAQAAGVVYTRYGDDLAFSGEETFDHAVERFATQVTVILREEGFAIQHRKTSVMRRSVRQHLAGLVINQRLSPQRDEFDRLKAILTNCVRYGATGQNREGLKNFREHLTGRISFIESIHAGKGKRLRAIFQQVAWE